MDKTKNEGKLGSPNSSSSVADAIQFCSEYLTLSQFKGCEATVSFLRMIDRLFDILNSRNPFGKGYKAPLRPANESSWHPFLDKATAYLLSLKNAANEPMYATKRKTVFLGLLCTISSVQSMYSEYVARECASMKYLLTYKFSQDHLELFFGAIRASYGRNNNPTV